MKVLPPPSDAAPATGRVPVGAFVLDLDGGELFAPDGRPAGLRRQALEVLLVLGRHAGRVVSKDTLMDRVWPDVVVGDGSLAQAITDIRRVLGDTDHRLVRNLARRGYLLATAPDLDVPVLSIAVLPPRIGGPGTDDPAGDALQWLAPALHGDLVGELSRMHEAHVIARDSTLAYDTPDVDPRRVARELRVRHVVRLELRRQGDALHLGVALIDGADAVQRWSGGFTLARAELPRMVSDVAIALARALQPELVRSIVERRSTLSPRGVGADELAMQAFASFNRGLAAEHLAAGLALAQRAVALDEHCVRGWSALCFMSLQALNNGWIDDRTAAIERIDRAVDALQRIDRDSPRCYQARTIQAYLRGDWPGMLRLTAEWSAHFRDPLAAGARGMALLLDGRPDEAVSALETALRLSPRDTIRAEWQYRLATAHFMAGRDELAADWGWTAATTHPGLPWPPIHAAALARSGEWDEARRALADHRMRHAEPDAAAIARRLPGSNPRVTDCRAQLGASLRALAGR